MNKLKRCPCPFCGSEDLGAINLCGYIGFECQKCDARGPNVYPDHGSYSQDDFEHVSWYVRAEKAWNKRNG